MAVTGTTAERKKPISKDKQQVLNDASYKRIRRSVYKILKSHNNQKRTQDVALLVHDALNSTLPIELIKKVEELLARADEAGTTFDSQWTQSKDDAGGIKQEVLLRIPDQAAVTLKSSSDFHRLGTLETESPYQETTWWTVTPKGRHIFNLEVDVHPTQYALLNKRGEVLTKEAALRLGMNGLLDWTAGKDEEARVPAYQELRRLGFGPLKAMTGPIRKNTHLRGVPITSASLSSMAKAAEQALSAKVGSGGYFSNSIKQEDAEAIGNAIRTLLSSGLAPVYQAYVMNFVLSILSQPGGFSGHGSDSQATLSGDSDITLKLDRRDGSLVQITTRHLPSSHDDRTNKPRFRIFHLDRLDEEVWLGRAESGGSNTNFLINKNGDWKVIPRESIRETGSHVTGLTPVILDLDGQRVGFSQPPERHFESPELLSRWLYARYQELSPRRFSASARTWLSRWIREAWPRLSQLSPQALHKEVHRMEAYLRKAYTYMDEDDFSGWPQPPRHEWNTKSFLAQMGHGFDSIGHDAEGWVNTAASRSVKTYLKYLADLSIPAAEIERMYEQLGTMVHETVELTREKIRAGESISSGWWITDGVFDRYEPRHRMTTPGSFSNTHDYADALTAQGKVELSRIEEDIKNRGAEASVERTQNEIIITENGFDTVRRARMILFPESRWKTVLLENKGQSTLLTHFNGDKAKRRLKIVDDRGYEGFQLGKSEDGYYLVSPTQLDLDYGPFTAPPVKMGKLWLGEDTRGQKSFMRLDRKKPIPIEGDPPPFYGDPEPREGSYLVARDHAGGFALISAEEPNQYSFQMLGKPEDYDRLWRAERYQGVRLPVDCTMDDDEKTDYALINKHNLNQAVGFDQLTDLGNAYLLQSKGRRGGKLVDKTDVMKVTEVSEKQVEDLVANASSRAGSR